MHEYCPSGIRHVGGAKLNPGSCMERENLTGDAREKAQAAPTARPKGPMRGEGPAAL